MRKLDPEEKPVPLKSPPLPPFRYAGGKYHERKKIVGKMPPHKTYVEPFAGAGNVLLAKPPAEKEILSDKNPQIMKVHKALKNRSTEWDMRPSHRKWDRLVAKPPSQRSGYEQAYVIEHSYGGKGEHANFHPTGKTLPMSTSKLHEREKDVIMKTQDFAPVMKDADSKQTLHYLDPPYSDKVATSHYGEENQVAPERVAEVANKMDGKVMISYNNDLDVKKLFKRSKWKVQKIGTSGGMAGDGHHDRSDILITNFNPQKERKGCPPYIDKQKP